MRADNAPNAHSWVRELRVAVFELGQPPPGDGPSETLFSLLDNKSDNFKDDESVIGMAIERLVTNNPGMLNTPNSAGDTPLLVAIEMNLSHVVQILISLGADASLLGKCKCSVLHAACKNLATRIDSKDEDIDRKSAIRIIESLLEMPIVEKILDTKREGGATCIHDVAVTGSAHVLQLLLEKNANPYTCDDYNRTALHLSCAQQDSDRNTEVVSLLCELVEDALDWQDFEGNTALHLAARVGNFNAVQQLLQTAANPSIKNIAGATPFDVASANNHQDVAEIIEEYVIVGDDITEEDMANELKSEAKEHINPHSNPHSSVGIAYNHQFRPHGKMESSGLYDENQKGPVIPPTSYQNQHPQTYHHPGQQHLKHAWLHSIGNSTAKNSSDTSASNFSEMEWGEAVTEDGRRYFFNTVTGETQWEMPVGWQHPGMDPGFHTVYHSIPRQTAESENLTSTRSHVSPNQQPNHQHPQMQVHRQAVNHRNTQNVNVGTSNTSSLQSNRLSHPSPPPAINTSPHQMRQGIPQQQHGIMTNNVRSPSPIQHQYSPQQARHSVNNGGYSPQSTSSNSSYLTSPRGTPTVSPHVSPQHPQGIQFRSRYDQHSLTSIQNGSLFSNSHQNHKPLRQGRSSIPTSSSSRVYQPAQGETMGGVNGNAPSSTKRHQSDYNKHRFMQAAMQNLAHVISPMNLDNPALNKRLIEERRRAREERRKRIRKLRKGGRR